MKLNYVIFRDKYKILNTFNTSLNIARNFNYLYLTLIRGCGKDCRIELSTTEKDWRSPKYQRPADGVIMLSNKKQILIRPCIRVTFTNPQDSSL